MFKKMLRNGAGRIALFTFALLAPRVQNTVFGQALNMDGQSVADVVSAPPNSSGAPTTADVSVAQNEIFEIDGEIHVQSPLIAVPVRDPQDQKTAPSVYK